MADFLHGVEHIHVSDGIRPITIPRFSVIGIVGTAGKGPVNTPVLLAGDLRQAVATFGAFQNDGFSLPEAIQAVFDQGPASIVAINVTDPATDRVVVNNEVIAISGYKGKTSKTYVSDFAPEVTGVKARLLIENTISIKKGTAVASITNLTGNVTYANGNDYTTSVNGGFLHISNESGIMPMDTEVLVTYTVSALGAEDYTFDSDSGTITIKPNSALPKNGSLVADYNAVSSTANDAADVIGTANGGVFTGAKAFLSANTVLGVTPRLLVAPRWTHTRTGNVANSVAMELVSIAEQLRGVAIVDATNGTKEEAVAYRGDFGSKSLLVHYPFHKVAAPDNTIIEQPGSARIAGLIAYTDGVDPASFASSPSNRILKNVLGLSKVVTFSATNSNNDTQYLNEHEVCTTVRQSGFRLYGNRTTSLDPQFAFINVSRTSDIIAESILMAHLYAVDLNISGSTIQMVLDSVDSFLRSLKARGIILGGTVWADPTLNTAATIKAGQLFIDYEYTPMYPLERLTFRAHLVDRYIDSVIPTT